ncbi:MAG: MlaE family lipid ABC transporter permease subunit [Pseudomonadota bacterium]
MIAKIQRLGSNVIETTEEVGRMSILLWATFIKIFSPPFKFGPIFKQIHFIGAKSMFVIAVSGAFTGMVLGLQGYYTLNQFGSVDLLGSAVALSLIRELGPVLTALMVIGRAGSAICAEIGIMRSDEQIAALECMAIDPVKYLLVPKYVAAILTLPLLTSIFDVVGVGGGYFAGVILFDVNPGAYFSSMYDSVKWNDINMGLIKSFVFGLLIVWITSSKGYYLHLAKNAYGAEGVSRLTTEAVVIASIAILVSDYLLTAILL